MPMIHINMFEYNASSCYSNLTSKQLSGLYSMLGIYVSFISEKNRGVTGIHTSIVRYD